MRFDYLELSPTADFHSHLRDKGLMEMVTRTIRQGGVDTVYVMPNLQPPITTVAAALSYRHRLQLLAPDVTFLMTLFLNASITPAIIADAARAGLTGVKAYPTGVTTHSDTGVLDFEQYFPVFDAMQTHDLVLNLHGEVPSTPAVDFITTGDTDAVTVLNAETMFLPTLHKLHAAFPRLRIVLEHCSTSEALEAVRACGPTVAATITAHHLWMTIDDCCGSAFNFCKPVAKSPADRVALVRAIVQRNSGKFFFGSDSAPHVLEAKQGGAKTAAGCFTQAWATQLVIGAIEEGIKREWLQEEEVTSELLDGFLSGYGRRFYKIENRKKTEQQKIVLEKKGAKIPKYIENKDGSIRVVPFKSGEDTWNLRWE